MPRNANLHNAVVAKKDEFYTQLEDIEDECRHYKKQFKGKVILCNCDDPYESNFFKYFAMNFNPLGLKKLIATCYLPSPIAYTELDLFSDEQPAPKVKSKKKPYKVEITEVKDENGDGRIDLADVEYLMKNRKNVLTYLKGNGDFRSQECIELLKQADIVVTNPPFSLFREYVAQLFEYDKKFLIIGNKNAITYKEIFPFIESNKLWIGQTPMGKDLLFNVSKDFAEELRKTGREGSNYKIVNGQVMGRSASVWFTNLDVKKRHEPIILYKTYHGNEKNYPTYDNYDAIEVAKVAEIPVDYDGVMGVPLSFMDKYNPEQFEILGLSQKYGLGAESIKLYDDYKEVRQDGSFTGSTGKKTNGNPVLRGKPQSGNYYVKGKIMVHSLYSRIFIRRCKNED